MKSKESKVRQKLYEADSGDIISGVHYFDTDKGEMVDIPFTCGESLIISVELLCKAMDSYGKFHFACIYNSVNLSEDLIEDLELFREALNNT